MEVYFWGTRGSMPASIRTIDIEKKVRYALSRALEEGLNKGADLDGLIYKMLPFWARGTFGSNTPCVEIRDGEHEIICDSGSGIRDLGINIIRSEKQKSPCSFHILLSHIHWDHIQGFPFFVPAYVKGNKINIYGCHEDIEKVFRLQQEGPSFPVRFEWLPATVEFHKINCGEYHDINGFKVLPKEQKHPGSSYGYRIEKDDKVIIYSTDSEHKSEADMAEFEDFFRNADFLIFDAQYTALEAFTVKEDWGHSNNLIGVELAARSGVKHLCLFHTEPTADDERLYRLLSDTKRLADIMVEKAKLKVSMAWDGLVIKI